MGKLQKVAKFIENHAEFIAGVAVGLLVPVVYNKVSEARLPVKVDVQASIETAEAA